MLNELKVVQNYVATNGLENKTYDEIYDSCANLSDDNAKVIQDALEVIKKSDLVDDNTKINTLLIQRLTEVNGTADAKTPIITMFSPIEVKGEVSGTMLKVESVGDSTTSIYYAKDRGRNNEDALVFQCAVISAEGHPELIGETVELKYYFNDGVNNGLRFFRKAVTFKYLTEVLDERSFLASFKKGADLSGLNKLFKETLFVIKSNFTQNTENTTYFVEADAIVATFPELTAQVEAKRNIVLFGGKKGVHAKHRKAGFVLDQRISVQNGSDNIIKMTIANVEKARENALKAEAMKNEEVVVKAQRALDLETAKFEAEKRAIEFDAKQSQLQIFGDLMAKGLSIEDIKALMAL
jgi:hypothetical protein